MKLFRLLLCLCGLSILFLAGAPGSGIAQQGKQWQLATFAIDVTPPVGHMLFTGGFQKSTGVTTRLEARGFALLPPVGHESKPLVVCSVDWGEIRNDAYNAWRDTLAEAVGTDRKRVLVTSIHQHDTALADLTAEKVLRDAGSEHQVIDQGFHADVLVRLAEAAEQAVAKARPVTHFGVGKAEVERIASNRRYVLEDGSVHYNRGSATTNLSAQRAPEGDIDPWLRTLSFWDGDKALCALSVYATHPMSFYRTAKTDADFPGMARRKRQAEDPDVFQIYASGCSGNVPAGKYNDGSRENRQPLADRLYQAMSDAWSATERKPLGENGIAFRLAKLRLEPRVTDGYSIADLKKKIAEKADARSHCMSALGLSWHAHADDPGHRIDVPAIDFGDAVLLLLPGEMYVEYQLYANQEAGKERTVLTMGYGESGPGYIPIERAWQEKDANLNDWCWIAPDMESRVKAVIREALGKVGTTE